MFHLAAPPWQIVVRTVIVYAALLLGLRLMGKREMGQMTVFDLVVLLVISNAVQNAMVGQDTSVIGGLIAAACLLVVNRLVAALRLHNPRLRRAIEGVPTVLVLHGQLVQQGLRREGVDPSEIDTALREHGIDSVEGVRLAVLEPDGSISIVPQETGTLRAKRHTRYLKHS